MLTLVLNSIYRDRVARKQIMKILSFWGFSLTLEWAPGGGQVYHAGQTSHPAPAYTQGGQLVLKSSIRMDNLFNFLVQSALMI